jgi:hypothetical protein
MENLHIGLREIIEGGGVLGIGGWLIFKYGKNFINGALPFLKTWQKNKTEENKLKIKMGGSSTTEIVDMLKTQIDELKEEQKAKDIRHQEEKEKFLHRIMELEISLATLRERYKEKGLHSRGSGKKK